MRDQAEQKQWERVCDDDGGEVYRFPVPGGWLYQTKDHGRMSGPVFVPEPKP